MTPVPPAALAVIAAAAEDYRLMAPPEERTPAGLAQLVATYLATSGYRITGALADRP